MAEKKTKIVLRERMKTARKDIFKTVMKAKLESKKKAKQKKNPVLGSAVGDNLVAHKTEEYLELQSLKTDGSFPGFQQNFKPQDISLELDDLPPLEIDLKLETPWSSAEGEEDDDNEDMIIDVTTV